MGQYNKLAVIIPYRDREKHLSIFISHITSFLKKQELDYKIYVIEQAIGKPFNRGLLANIGFCVDNGKSNYICVHDVDLLPIESNYKYQKSPTQLCHYIDNKIRATPHLGGVFIAPSDQFRSINGFSNKYWGWGEEDNDLDYRFIKNNIKLGLLKNGKYEHTKHPQADTKNICANNRLYKNVKKGKENIQEDGLSSLNYVELERKMFQSQYKEELFRWVLVKV